MRFANKLRIGLVVCSLATASLSHAATAKIDHLRGQIVSLSGQALTVRRNSGDVVKVTLAPDIQIGAVKKIALSDIKKGDYVGIAALTGVDGTMTAQEVHVFPAAMRGAGEGHRSFDLGANSTMTNGDVGSVVESSQGRQLKVAYKGGSKEITVPPNVPVVTFIDADRSDLQAGKKVILFVEGSGTDFTSHRLLVEKNGVAPPM